MFYLLRPILVPELVIIFPDYATLPSVGTFSILLYNHDNTFIIIFKHTYVNNVSKWAQMHFISTSAVILIC